MLFSIGSCNHSNEKSQVQENFSGQLVRIDLNDSNFSDLNLHSADTLTQNGWSIKYLIKNDSTKYNDIYIEWSKGNIKGIYKAESVLQFRRYFIPQYVGENDNYLFLKHGCATDCSGILVLSKDSTFSQDYIRVIDYNIPNGQVVYVTEVGTKDDSPFQVAVVDLPKHLEHLAQFKNLCMYASHKESCIDTIVFKKDLVSIKATLTIDNSFRNKEVSEELKISLK